MIHVTVIGKAEKNAAKTYMGRKGRKMRMDEELIRKAYEAQTFSYSPYSQFQVGAALLAGSGKVYTGCNIENAAFSPTNCAERTAFFKAISEGETEFEAIAIVGNRRNAAEEEKEFCTPCGVCRQVMLEFTDPEKFRILCIKGKEIRQFTLHELLPESFSPRMLAKGAVSEKNRKE